jgi:hypothetical protein
MASRKMRRHVDPALDQASRYMQVPASPDVTPRGGGLAFRLLKCDRCDSVWPTEREPAHGGSRQDGEPCAYAWPDGRVCGGTVHPLWGRRGPADPFAPPPRQAAYSGRWCDVLGVEWGTRDLALVRRRYRELAKERHPDAGGSHAAMVALNAAYRQALAELGQPGA